MVDEPTLDPADWSDLTEIGRDMLYDTMQFLASVRERPVWRPMPKEVRRALADRTVPRSERPLRDIYADFQRLVEPYILGNVHPRFWGWVIGASSPVGVLAELLSARLNANVFGADEAAAAVEAQVIGWFQEVFGLPPHGGGLLVSGGSMANLVALTIARDAQAGFDVVAEGLSGRPPLTFYCSAETHNSVDKAASMLGIGQKYLRRIRTDETYRVDLGELRRTIAADRAAGMQPVCVIGNCGTVNTGQFDDLRALRAIASEEGLWLHVDAAFGASLRFSERLAPLADGLEAADSIAFDLHKWMNMPYEVACVLTRDRATQARSFSPPATYLSSSERGLAAGRHVFNRVGPELSRGFRALKVWMTLQTYGLDRFAAIVEKNVEQARFAAELIDREPLLELLAPVASNVVCFRYRRDGLSDQTLNSLNQEILVELQESGTAVPSSTMLRGRYALRMAIVNQRTLRSDVELALREVVRIGDSRTVPDVVPRTDVTS